MRGEGDGAAAIADTRPRFVAYDTANRPLCGLCGPATRKRAVFFEVRRERPPCAWCAVERVRISRASEAHEVSPTWRGSGA